ncbi:hypothetical protein K504DRAFT_467089 [Pleomassaria siparia CBS 279.74]|uniref:Uncharacterized protein n=1 Tax=Pleomassaria siparia CBS 279.74 TaxID=1314801 RepID=A0A6G1JQB3_9PLEO|nr:hypothetical protein K504DRAFT_467089 [Pleomassaria siparia CBS 279.74]
MAPGARRGRPPGPRPLSNPGDDEGSVTSSKRSAADSSDEDTPATHKKAATALSKKKAAAVRPSPARSQRGGSTGLSGPQTLTRSKRPQFYTGIKTLVSLLRLGQRQSPAESLAETVAPSSPSNNVQHDILSELQDANQNSRDIYFQLGNLFKATNLFCTDFNQAVVSLRTLSSCFC